MIWKQDKIKTRQDKTKQGQDKNMFKYYLLKGMVQEKYILLTKEKSRKGRETPFLYTFQY